MRQSSPPLAPQIPDIADFRAVIAAHADFFKANTNTPEDIAAPIYVGRAPGRLDLMGGIADYSGSLVLELPLGVETWVAAQATSVSELEVFSPQLAYSDSMPLVKVPFPALFTAENQAGSYYQTARKLLNQNKQSSWVAYVAGVLVVLHHEYGVSLSCGVRLLVSSAVPVGKGLSSSAALEVATLQALCGLYKLELSGREMALLCQKVENLVVGAPCGIMDQMTVACGKQDHLLALLCQPAELEGNVKLPPEVQVWGIDSGISHAVSGADYVSVRIGAFMGYRIIAERMGLKVEQLGPGRVKIEDHTYKGYLANITPAQWTESFRDWIPVEVSGQDFLTKWGGISDLVTEVNPTKRYAVRQPTAHPIYEHQRVQQYRTILENNRVSLAESDLLTLGRLMYESHQSYNWCSMGSAGTDRLVELVKQAGPDKGLYGAKITGGGSGGTVAVLGLKEASVTISQIVAQYELESGRASLVLTGSAPGAATYRAAQLL